MFSRTIAIGVGPVSVEGDLCIPDGARGLVVFAHGSGSGRHSPRNQYVARQLVVAGIGTLLLDLLTESEEREEHTTGHLRFDITLLAGRLVRASEWVRATPGLSHLPIGYFGASTGAAAALVAAAHDPDQVKAVVSRGGRPDLAGTYLRRVRAPTLFIVGSHDRDVLRMNQDALAELGAPGRIVVIPGASHLFQEPGALEQVAAYAREFFAEQLTPHAPGPTAAAGR
jgi:pimeloyl-ACP methyl ester carboxylesterase